MRALTANYEGDLVFFSVEDIATKETILDSGICSEKDGDCGSGKNIKLMQESEKSLRLASVIIPAKNSRPHPLPEFPCTLRGKPPVTRATGWTSS